MAELTGPQVLTSVSPLDDVLGSPQILSFARLRALRNEPTVRLVRTLYLAPALAASWSTTATKHAPEGAKDFIDEQMQPYRSHLIRTALHGCFDYGFQTYEKVFKLLANNQIGLSKLKQLLPDVLEILVNGNDGAYTGIRQTTYNGTVVDLEAAKTFLTAFDVEGTNWYGESQVALTDDLYTSSKLTNDAAARHDANVAGSHWIIYYPIGTSTVNKVPKDNFEVAKDLLATLEASGGIIVPRVVREAVVDLQNMSDIDDASTWKIDLISAAGVHADYTTRLRYLDALKSRVLGFPERAILQGEFGTKAEAETHADFAILGVEARHADLVQGINWHIVNQLLRLNYGVDYDNTVSIVIAPLTDFQMVFLQKIFMELLGSPEGVLDLLDKVDLDAVQGLLGIPTLESTVYDSPGIDESGKTDDDGNTSDVERDSGKTWEHV